MAASFAVDKLNTAKKCLEWRDTLAAGGWTKTAPAPTERMKVLAGVEEFFHDKCVYIYEAKIRFFIERENGMFISSTDKGL